MICLLWARWMGQQSLLVGKEMKRYLPETFQWLKNINTLVTQVTIQISIVAIRQEWIRKIHIRIIEKVIRIVSRTQTVQTTFVIHPVHEIPQFDLVKRTHIEKKTYESGEDMWYIQWILYGLCLCELCIWTLYVNFWYTLNEAFFFWVKISMQATLQG